MKQNSAEHEFRDANWKLVGLRLLVFTRYWAKAHYGWCDGRLLPTSKTPEDVACDVYAAYSHGERKFSAEASMWVQLKSAVKSVLWNLHHLKEGKITSTEEPEFFEPVADGKPGPEAGLHSEEFCERFFELLYADSRVKKNSELRKIIEALEKGAQTVAEFVQETGLKTARVYELRRQLKTVAEPVLNKMNREGDCYEQALPKRGAAIA
ncbi:MAG: hypothetical protein HY299_05930 [Verrucomicrobia bacterium]|nr:hypothetical protein [Verrucomicrobiota bacterium]